MKVDTPILIVGAGPVGLALAGDLAWRGIPNILIEKTDGTITQPKMDLVGVRTMEFCRRWGIAKWVEESPYPRDYRQDCVYCTALTGYELGREPFPSMGDEPRPPQSPQKRERCPQDMFDPILRRFVAQFPHSAVRYETELVSLEEHVDHVRAEVRERDGSLRRLTARYVVGCDGGASTTRSLLGVGMSGDPVLTYTTNVIFRCANLPALHDKGIAYRFIFIGPDGMWATLVAINGNDRWRFSYVGTSEKAMPNEAELGTMIRMAIGRDFDFEILSVMPWVRRELVADSYGCGRVYLAGDAVHLMSPTGGFGMNTGIGDSVDLSWKLAAMIQGWGGDRLLESYGKERRPVALRNVKEASANLRRMLSPRQRRPPPEVFQAGEAGDAARQQYGDWYTVMMKSEWSTLGIHLGYRYDDSPIVIAEDTPPPADDPGSYIQTARTGARAPHVWLGKDRSTLDLFGQGFTLLRLGPNPPIAERLRRAAGPVPVREHLVPHEAAHQAYGRALVLVRPDGHVAWRGDEEPDDVAGLIDVVRGARDARYRAAARASTAAAE